MADSWPSSDLAPCVAALLCAALAVGCGGGGEPRLVDYLDELEFDVPLESAEYVSLGRYDIPIVARKASPTASPEHQPSEPPVWLRVQFELTAETTPRWKEAVAAAAEQHQGALSDAVLTVLRTSPYGDLSDPRLSAVNARLADVVRPMLGEDRVRQFIFNKLDQPDMKAASTSSEHGAHGGEQSHGEGEPSGHGAAAEPDDHQQHEEPSHGGHH